MRSHLTRRVIRTILRNEPLLHRNCLRRLHILGIRQLKPIRPSFQCQQQRRSVWWDSLTSKPKRILKPEKIDPGMDMLADQELLLKMGARKYSNTDLLEALREFFESKGTIQKPTLGKPELNKSVVYKPVLDTQINAVLATYKYLLTEREHDEEIRLTIEETALYLQKLWYDSTLPMAKRTVMLTETNLDSFATMADALFNDIKSRSDEWPVQLDKGLNSVTDGAGSTYQVRLEDSVFFRNCTQTYLDVLAYRLKDGIYARDKFLDILRDYPSLAKHAALSRPIVWALAYQGKHRELEQFLLQLEPELQQGAWYSLIEGAVLAEDIDLIKEWWDKRPAEPKIPVSFFTKLSTNLAILKLCINTGNMPWGQTVLNELVEMEITDKTAYRARQMTMILAWAMASGKSVDELEGMSKLICSRLDLSLRIEEINALLELAKSKKDPYYAERLFSLARKRGLPFNFTTYRLEMEWRILAGDIAGAQVSYNRLQSQEYEVEEISPAVNQLLLAMCHADPVPHERIMDIVGDFIESGGVFSAELIAALAKLHLERGEMHDLADLLHTYASSFSLAERKIVWNMLVQHIYETQGSGGKWDAYTFIKAIFPEISKSLRIDIMQEFFKANRYDLAMHVFGDMRASQIEDRRPDVTSYTALFEGLAYTRVAKALQTAHNMLRLDSYVEPDTNVKTSLMLAYTLCDVPAKALTIWEEIVNAPEGPSYKSINVAFRACQEEAAGLKLAKDIWTKLKQQDVEIPKETADSYIAMLAAQGQLEDAFQMVAQLEDVSAGQYTADAISIMAVLNLTTDEARQKSLDWAQQRYPEYLKQVEAAGKSPFERRYLLEPLLPKDGSYVGYWNLLGADEWELEYIDWEKAATEE